MLRLDLGLPSPRTVRNKFLLVITTPLCAVLLYEHILTKISHIAWETKMPILSKRLDILCLITTASIKDSQEE
jgi:hypothetical protein